MKAKAKIVGIVCAVALTGTVGVSSAFAAGYGGAGFVDANGDRTCDRVQTASGGGTAGAGYCMQRQAASTDGITTGAGAGCGTGANFTDENGDGVCDNVATGACGGAGCGYVDVNGDGVCDHAGSGAGAGMGMGGRGFHGGR